MANDDYDNNQTDRDMLDKMNQMNLLANIQQQISDLARQVSSMASDSGPAAQRRNTGFDPHQFTVTGRIKPSRTDTDLIVFSFRMGLLKVVCIVNIPPEGDSEAPVYVKLRLLERTPDMDRESLVQPQHREGDSGSATQ